MASSVADLLGSGALNGGAVPLAKPLLARMDAYWRAANYLSVGQIYLRDNPLLEEPLRLEHVKPRLLGHWGTTPGLNLLYVHLNRLIKEHDLNMIAVIGPGHGGPGMVANTYLEGSYTERYPAVERNRAGLRRLFRQFSWPYGVSSHVSPAVPGSIHEGGELGYSLLHAYGAAFDNPDLLVACVIGDGEAETGPLAASWHSNKFLNPRRDGAVLPILHLNGFKIANPALLARISRPELLSLMGGYGYEPVCVEGDDPAEVHQALAAALDACLGRIRAIQERARGSAPRSPPDRPLWPMIVLATPKGWTGPKTVAGKPVEGTWRAHQVPITDLADPERLSQLESWMRSYRPHELFDARGALREELASLAPTGPDGLQPSRQRRRALKAPEAAPFSPLRGGGPRSRFGDRGGHPRAWRVLGGGEGYLLTGRHGLFSCYEAFIHIIDSMFNQHAKWLKTSREIPWRRPIASLNYLLTSHVWRQDHNGFSHQDPGFIDHVANKKSDAVRIYLPPDANCLLSVVDHCLRSRDYVNLIIAGKQPQWQWLDIEAAARHCAAGLGVWDWASFGGEDPDVVMACAGDVPTLEVLAAVSALRGFAPDMRIRVVNVVDLLALQPQNEHPHGLSDEDFDQIFTPAAPVVFAYHGYPALIHRLTYRRRNHQNIHVRGYKEEGTTTTPFDMTVLNNLDRFQLALDAVRRAPRFAHRVGEAEDLYWTAMERHALHISEFGEDLPEVRNWRWSA